MELDQCVGASSLIHRFRDFSSLPDNLSLPSYQFRGSFFSFVCSSLLCTTSTATSLLWMQYSVKCFVAMQIASSSAATSCPDRCLMKHWNDCAISIGRSILSPAMVN